MMRLRLGLGLCLGLCISACAATGDDGFAGLETINDETLGGIGSSGSGNGGTAPGSSSGEAETTSGPGTGVVTTGLSDTATSSDPSEATSVTVTSDPTTATTTGPDETTGSAETGEPGPPADCPRVRVNTPGDVANVRPDPSTAMAPVGTLSHGALVEVLAIVPGEVVDGNGNWVQIQGNNITGYIWSGLATCTTDEPSTDGFFLPLPCGMTATVSQGNNGDFSHNGKSAYAFDFSLGSGTQLVAIADGTVTNVFAGTKPGDPCYNGGGQECNSAANYVQLLHDDGTSSIYGHLSEVHVNSGDFIKRGSVLGLSGSTGWSTGRHAHVGRQEACNFGWCQTIPVTFTDVPGDGVPVTGQSVTSGNCP